MNDTQAEMLQGPIDLLPAPFDGYEVALAVEVTDARGDSHTERVDDPATLRGMREEGSPLLLMFTVYGHFETGGVHAFADAVVTEDGNTTTSYEAQRQYALRLARTIDAGRTRHGVEDMTFDEPDEVIGECERCGEDVLASEAYLTGEEARGGVQHERCYDDDPEPTAVG